jgi:hypothetical protein
MKELVKPNNEEMKNTDSVYSYCETVCSGRDTCNRACDCRTYSNTSVEGDDILF